jgi:hypothetical protein
MVVSQKLIVAIKLSSKPAYKIAWSTGINPTMLSRLINGIEKPKPNDPRVLAIGKVLGIPENDCFQEEAN